jgi:hypothetical protein
MVERQCESIETSLPPASERLLWQVAQLPEPAKSSLLKVTRCGPVGVVVVVVVVVVFVVVGVVVVVFVVVGVVVVGVVVSGCVWQEVRAIATTITPVIPMEISLEACPLDTIIYPHRCIEVGHFGAQCQYK